MRAAIQEANALPGPDRIIFDSPLDLSYPNLPPIQDSLTLDGSWQWTTDTIGPRPWVSIGADSIVIAANDTTIIGLMFFGNTGSIHESAGITVGQVHGTRIGGPAVEDGNQIGYNKGNGIYIGGAGTLDNYVAGNSIGYKKDVYGIVQKAGNGHYSWQINGNVRGAYITATTTNFPTANTSEFSLSVQGHIFSWPMFLPGIINGK